MSGADTDQLAAAARARGVTLNTLLQVAWALVLSRLTDRDDVVFGVTVSGRPPELAGVETMVGLFINTMPLRVRLEPEHDCRSAMSAAAARCRRSCVTTAIWRTPSCVRWAGWARCSTPCWSTRTSRQVTWSAAANSWRDRCAFRPAAMESLSHFPMTIAAHRGGAELTLLVEVTDDALGVDDRCALGAGGCCRPCAG